MKRQVRTKISALSARHPGLRDKLHGMFDACWPVRDVRRMLERCYGETLSDRSIARYKSEHRRAQRELVEAMCTALQEAREASHWIVGPPGRC
jgi:hypothetical protein